MLGRSSKAIFVVTLLAALAAAQTIPSGTRITVRMGLPSAPQARHTGQKFDGTLASNLVVNGKTVARAGAPVRGKVTYAKSSGRLHEPGRVDLAADLSTGGRQDGSSIDVGLSRKG